MTLGDQTDVKWESAAPNAYVWTSTAYDMATADPPRLSAGLRRHHGVLACTVMGQCPRCLHEIPQTLVLSAVTERTTFDLEAIKASGNEAATVTVRCTCSETHAGRPDGRDGCGINFTLRVREEA